MTSNKTGHQEIAVEVMIILETRGKYLGYLQ